MAYLKGLKQASGGVRRHVGRVPLGHHPRGSLKIRWDLKVAGDLVTTAPPTPEELRELRELVAAT